MTITFTETPVLIGMALDQSTSMGGVAETAVSAVNEYFKSIKDTNGDASFLLTKFSSYDMIDIGEVTSIKDYVPLELYHTYKPQGMTALFDAIAKTILRMEEWLVEHKGVPALLVIQTDGEENNSREFRTADAIKKMINKKEKDGWTVVYLGADQDAMSKASAIGISGANTVAYVGSSRGTSDAISTLSCSTQGYMGGGAQQTKAFFGDKEGDGGVISPDDHKADNVKDDGHKTVTDKVLGVAHVDNKSLSGVT